MATYYMVNASGNFSAAGTWSTVSAKDETRTGATGANPTSADDCFIDDWSSNGGGIVLTVDATSQSVKSIDFTGYTGEFALPSGKQLTYYGQTVKFASGMTVSGTGSLRGLPGGGPTITPAGLTFPFNWRFSNATTYTLAGDLVITGTMTWETIVTPSGAYNITCGTFVINTGNTSYIVSGQSVTVTTSIIFGLATTSPTGNLLRAYTASSPAYLIYQGTPANCKMFQMSFTDIDASGSAQPLDNWYGNTLTRINNTQFTVSAANATVGATYTNNGQTFTVDATISGGTTLKTTRQTSLLPTTSGTLTKASGTGDDTITFSSFVSQGIVNKTSADLTPTDAEIAAAMWTYGNRQTTA